MNGMDEGSLRSQASGEVVERVAERLASWGISYVPQRSDDPIYDQLAERVVADVITPELERRDAMYEAAERQYAEVTDALRTELARYKAAHDSAQRGLIRMERQRDELRMAILRKVGRDTEDCSTIDVDFVALLGASGSAPEPNHPPEATSEASPVRYLTSNCHRCHHTYNWHASANRCEACGCIGFVDEPTPSEASQEEAQP